MAGRVSCTTVLLQWGSMCMGLSPSAGCRGVQGPSACCLCNCVTSVACLKDCTSCQQQSTASGCAAGGSGVQSNRHPEGACSGRPGGKRLLALRAAVGASADGERPGMCSVCCLAVQIVPVAQAMLQCRAASSGHHSGAVAGSRWKVAQPTWHKCASSVCLDRHAAVRAVLHGQQDPGECACSWLGRGGTWLCNCFCSAWGAPAWLLVQLLSHSLPEKAQHLRQRSSSQPSRCWPG